MKGLLNFFKIVYFRHRNSQKRIIFEDAIYFITSKTYGNHPYFRERMFCDLFVENLKLCKRMKGFLLYGWVLNYDHFHLLIQPNDGFDISKIMKSFKENVSCAINRITDALISPEGATTSSRLQGIYRDKYDISDFKSRFQQKYPNQNPFPKFQWQKSYFDHYIRNESDFAHHLDYILYNPEKHGLPDDWTYSFLNPQYEYLIDE